MGYFWVTINKKKTEISHEIKFFLFKFRFHLSAIYSLLLVIKCTNTFPNTEAASSLLH